MVRFSALILVGLLLAGCATTFDPRACPREKIYSKAEQKAFLDGVGKSPLVIQNMLVDYGKLRDQARACRGGRFDSFFSGG
jgi:hypothetical protein